MRVKYKEGVVRLTNVRSFAEPEPPPVRSTRKFTWLEAVIPVGAGSSKFKVSFSFERWGETGAVKEASGATPAEAVTSVPSTNT
jgi:hypothetical protein